MAKRMILLAAVMLLILAWTPAAYAADIQWAQPDEKTDAMQHGLSSEAMQMLDDYEATDGTDWEQGLQSIFSYLVQHWKEYVSDGLRSAAAVVAIGIFSRLAVSLCQNRDVSFAVTAVCVLAVTAAATQGVLDFADLASAALDDMNTFSKAMLPTLTAAAASGAALSAAAKYAATALFMDVLMTVVQSFVMPMIYVYLAVSMASVILQNSGLEASVRLIKWVIVTALTAIVLVFTVYLSITGVISSSADVAATKLTKTAISTVLPVVGGILSDAAGAVVSGMAVLKGAVGAYGLLGVTAVCAVPCVRLGIHWVLYKAAAAVAAAAAGDSTAKMIHAVSDAYAMMLGTVGTSAAVLFIAVISMMKVVSGL